MDKNYINSQIGGLRALAKEKGYKLVFRNHPTEQGDFCIFIYTPQRKKIYTIGFDGDWDAREDSPCHFDNCVMDARDFIIKFSSNADYRKKHLLQIIEKNNFYGA